MRTKLVNLDEFSGRQFEDITNGGRPPVDEGEPPDEDTVQEPPPGPQETHSTGGSSDHWKKPRFLVWIPTKCAVKSRER